MNVTRLAAIGGPPQRPSGMDQLPLTPGRSANMKK